MGELDVLEETWVRFERPPPLPAEFATARGSKPPPPTWIERYDRHGLDLRHALVSSAWATGAIRAELTPRDFNELCMEAGPCVQYVAIGDSMGIRLMTPDGHLTVVPIG